MKKIIVILCLFLSSTLWAAEPVQLARMNPYIAGSGVAAAVPSLKDSYPTSSYGSGDTLYGDCHAGVHCSYGQGFTSTGWTITSVKFYLKKVGSPTGNVSAKLVASTGTLETDAKPTGSALATSNTVDISTLTTSMVLYEFTFPVPYASSNGVVYFVVAEYTGGDASNYLHIGYGWGGHAGNPAYFYWDSWTETGVGNVMDCIFYLYGT